MNFTMMKRILEDRRFSLPLAARALAVIQPEMIRQGFRTFPVVALVGRSRCGKTELFRAVIGREGYEVDLCENTADVIELLTASKNKFSFLDDFANLTTDSGLRKQKKTIDVVTRLAHKGKLGVLGVTMESDAKKYLAESCVNRMLVVEMGRGVEDDEFSQRLTYLQESNDVDQLTKKFSRFMETKTCQYMQELCQYRESMKTGGERNQRQIAMVFCYRKTMALLDEFFRFSVEDGLDMDKIAAIEKSFYAKTLVVGNDARAELAELLLRKLIVSGEIVAQITEVSDDCSEHIKHGCSHRGYLCERGICEANLHHDWVQRYSPNDLFLDYSCGSNALLLTDPQMIPGFRRPFHVPPLLVMEADLLTVRLNSVLEMYCCESGERHKYFAHETLRKCLMKTNRCVVTPNRSGGFRYTQEYLSINEGDLQPVRVVLLQLREEEVDFLMRTGIKRGYAEHTRRRLFSADCGKLLKIFSKEWPKMAFNCGPVGEPVPEE